MSEKRMKLLGLKVRGGVGRAVWHTVRVCRALEELAAARGVQPL